MTIQREHEPGAGGGDLLRKHRDQSAHIVPVAEELRWRRGRAVKAPENFGKGKRSVGTHVSR